MADCHRKETLRWTVIMRRIKARAAVFHAIGGDAGTGCLVGVDRALAQSVETQEGRCHKDRDPA